MRGIGFYGHDFFIIKTDADLVSESITRIIMTNFKERIGHPFMGGNLKPSLFELEDQAELDGIKINLANQIAEYEPRANLTSIDISADQVNENAILATIQFTLVGDPSQDPRILTLTIQS
jgi:phage baseplate assembly protein W